MLLMCSCLHAPMARQIARKIDPRAGNPDIHIPCIYFPKFFIFFEGEDFPP